MGEDVEYSRDNGVTWQSENTFTGLTPATEYTFVARYKETATHNPSPDSGSVSGYTLAAIPGLTAVADGSDTITLTIESNGNPEGTEYKIERSEDSEFSEISIVMDWDEGTDFADTGLEHNTTYYYRVMARNGDEIETDWSNQATATTLHLYGNPTGSGEVNVRDAILVLRSIVGLVDLTEAEMVAADVNGDGEVTVQDAILILRYIVGLIDFFPVEE